MIQFPRWVTTILWIASVCVGAAILADLAETSQGDKYLAAANMVLATLIAQGRAPLSPVPAKLEPLPLPPPPKAGEL